MKDIRKLVFSALFVAIGVVLPLAFHAVPRAGSTFLPMHIAILLCGLFCGWAYGAACGILTPLLSSLLTGMPPVAMLASMIPELAVYGLVAGLLRRYIKTGHKLADLYIALVGAMLTGRVVFGVLNALLFRAGNYNMDVWLTAAFVTALPGILIQLVLLPAIVLTLEKMLPFSDNN